MTEDKYKTEKQLLEELSKLRKSEQFFRNIALCSGDWIWEVDHDCVYTCAAGSKANILGYSDEEIIGKTPFDLMPDDETERVRTIFVNLMRKKKPIVDLENMNLTKKGKKVHILTNGLPMLDDNGKLLGYSGVDKDITAIKEAGEQIESDKKKSER